ncbi:MAG TPA: tetratricopeptide repeat protein [Thermoanaerobaculia bacterium]|nr:tetratricopeptide repeat protein [Thermoanaerobaculia bacterium]
MSRSIPRTIAIAAPGGTPAACGVRSRRRAQARVAPRIALLLACASPAAWGQPQDPASPPTTAPASAAAVADLGAIPVPVLDDFEPAVREQLEESRLAVERMQADGSRRADVTEALGELCLVYLRYELMAAAEPCLRQVRALQPVDFRWPYYQTILYVRDGDLVEARASVDAALALRPGDVPALLRSGDLHLREQELDEAERAFTAALEREPSSSAARFGLGRIVAARGDPAAAAGHFEAALAGQPAGSLVHYHVGMAYRALGELERARAELAKNRQQPILFPDPLAARLDALSVSQRALLFRGVEARRRGRPELAVGAFEELLVSDPDNADARYNLARALIDLGRLADAERHLRRSIEVRPDFFDAHFNLAVILGRREDGDGAVRHLTRAVEIDPDHLPTRVLWARLVAQQGRRAEAIAELEQVLSIDAATPGARLALGAIEADLGNLEAAKRHLRAVAEQAAGADRERSQAHLLLARLDPRGTPRQQVLAHLRSAVDLDPGGAPARAALAEELARGGDLAPAADEFGRLVELSPEDAGAHLGRGMTLVLAGRYGRARESLEASVGRLPDHPALGDLLARLLATCPDPAVRDGERAIVLAERVVEVDPTVDHLETLAMALAEAGRWEEAAVWQRRALAQEEASSGSTSERRRHRLTLYEQRQPVRAPWIGPQ